jgi:hypothetical protein
LPKFEDLTGLRFGKWTVIKRGEDHITGSGNRFTTWDCICDCGTRKNVIRNSLTSGRSTSCGCEHREIQKKIAKNNFSTHGCTGTRLYNIWNGMKKRCYNNNASNYNDYGGRGIFICDEWLNDYQVFKTWALQNGYTDSLSIDRINNNDGYYPENCRWVDRVTQCNNRRSNVEYNVFGKIMTLSECAREYGINYKSLHKKIKAGKNIEEILQQSIN